MGIFGLANQMPPKKAWYTSVTRSAFTSGQIDYLLQQFTIRITLLSLMMMVVAGALIFHFNMRGDWTLFVVISILSAFMTVGNRAIDCWLVEKRRSVFRVK